MSHRKQAVHKSVPVGFLLAALTLVGCGAEEMKPAPSSPRPIAWAEVEVYTPVLRRRLPGVVQSVRRAQLSFELGGKVKGIAVDVGDRISEGQVLASLDPQTFELQAQRARAGLQEAQAAAREAQGDLDRQMQLVAEGFASQAVLDQVRAARETATSRVASARSSLSIAQENLEDTHIIAPYAGRVSRRLVEPEQQVAAGQAVVSVQGKPDALEVLVMVPETLIDTLRRGSRHPVTFPVKSEWESVGKIIEIGTDTGDGGTYPVTLLLDDAVKMPRPGMTAEVGFYASGENAPAKDLLTIPVTSFVSLEDDGTACFVYDGNRGTVVQRKVTIADVFEGKALVSAGLRPGERVATKGVAFLKNGQAVVLLGEGPARSEQEDIKEPS